MILRETQNQNDADDANDAESGIWYRDILKTASQASSASLSSRRNCAGGLGYTPEMCMWMTTCYASKTRLPPKTIAPNPDAHTNSYIPRVNHLWFIQKSWLEKVNHFWFTLSDETQFKQRKKSTSKGIHLIWKFPAKHSTLPPCQILKILYYNRCGAEICNPLGSEFQYYEKYNVGNVPLCGTGSS